jgi:hypothetical protein
MSERQVFACDCLIEDMDTEAEAIAHLASNPTHIITPRGVWSL